MQRAWWTPPSEATAPSGEILPPGPDAVVPLSQSGDYRLLVAEVGDELEGAAEGGDEPVEDVLSGDVAAFDLGDAGDGDAHPGGDLLLGEPAALAHLGQPPARASSTMAETAALKASWPPAVCTARSR